MLPAITGLKPIDFDVAVQVHETAGWSPSACA